MPVRRVRGLGAWTLAALTSAVAAASQATTPATLTVEQIVEKNVAARGGLEAWRRIQTMVWTGHIETGNSSGPAIPFVLEYKRPNKMRFETRADHGKSVRVFNGAVGWKAQTASGGAPTLKPYSALELRSARDAQGIGGLLIDHKARGIGVALEGVDQVEGRPAYRLALALPSGSMRHLWVDAQTFLDLKYERDGRASGGRTASMSYSDWRTIAGLQMPMTIETDAQGRNASEKMVIEDVTLNPSLSDAHFERPSAPQPRNSQPGLRSSSGSQSDFPRRGIEITERSWDAPIP